MPDPTKMTTDEIRDWLMQRRGWRIERDGILVHPDEEDGRAQRAGVLPRHDHPIPATLDAAAEAMPEGWVWYRIKYGVSRIRWEAHTTGKSIRIPDTGNEIADRFRLAMLCILAEENAHE